MPRGKFTNHKGRARRFTSPEELEEQSKQDQFKQRQRKKEESEESEDNDSEEEGSGSSDSEEEGEHGKGKGVEKLIEVENPNRIQKKSKKLSTLNSEQTLDTAAKPELSRREREELEKQRAWAHYNKMHAEGKTDEARADLARLAIIKKQREEAAKKREEEKQAKEAAKQAKTAATNKALGKKT